MVCCREVNAIPLLVRRRRGQACAECDAYPSPALPMLASITVQLGFWLNWQIASCRFLSEDWPSIR